MWVIVTLSMTGFGRSVKENELNSVTVEIKSVNHRYLETLIRMPKQFIIIEDRIKKAIQNKLNRGRIEVYITVEGQGLVNKEILIDWKLLDQLTDAWNQIKEKINSNDDIRVNDLIRFQDVITINETDNNDDSVAQLILEAVEEAVSNLEKMRSIEGEQLKLDILNNISSLKESVSIVEEIARMYPEKIREKTFRKLKDILEGQLDEQRIYMEVAVLAEKSDVAEEISRLSSHFIQFESELESNEPVGRKLDFIVQEMNRECNTIGSKVNDMSITKLVIEMKSKLEKIREQVQNIE
ncbi:MAG: yloC [Bacillales bacterium]|nr:yloC [Bacillales bacterium]